MLRLSSVCRPYTKSWTGVVSKRTLFRWAPSIREHTLSTVTSTTTTGGRAFSNNTGQEPPEVRVLDTSNGNQLFLVSGSVLPEDVQQIFTDVRPTHFVYPSDTVPRDTIKAAMRVAGEVGAVTIEPPKLVPEIQAFSKKLWGLDFLKYSLFILPSTIINTGLYPFTSPYLLIDQIRELKSLTPGLVSDYLTLRNAELTKSVELALGPPEKEVSEETRTVLVMGVLPSIDGLEDVLASMYGTAQVATEAVEEQEDQEEMEEEREEEERRRADRQARKKQVLATMAAGRTRRMMLMALGLTAYFSASNAIYERLQSSLEQHEQQKQSTGTQQQ